MAPTSSPRDHDADANPDLSRKRARLSEEGESPVSDGPIEIEVLAPELIGEEPMNAIAIDDDDDDESMMAHYTENFMVFPEKDAVTQVAVLHAAVLDQAHHMQLRWYLDTAAWLAEHIEATEDESWDKDTLLVKYGRDDVFFGQFAKMAIDLIKGDEMFHADEVDRCPDIGDNVALFVINLMKLSVRFITLAPDFTSELARRDSAQVTPRPREQDIAALHYIQLARLLLTLNDNTAKYLRTHLGLMLKPTREKCRALIPEDGEVPRSLVSVLRDVCQHVREVKDAWHFIHTILALSRQRLYEGSDAEAVLEIANQSILPAIREKHPRALPDRFHETVVKWCGDLVQLPEAQLNIEEAWRLYERVVKGEHDALLSEGVTGPEKLRQVCNDDVGMILPLLRAAWVLQAHKSFIFSSIMDIRSCGIKSLSGELGEWYTLYCRPIDGGTDHPVIQYAARFLRSNDLTEYIFSANSHASIINHSQDIISYIAATLNYTDRETDVIWKACTTSVEADFVKASFAVLLHVSRHFSFQQLQYAIQKYIDTPVASTSSKAAVETLLTLFKHLHVSMPSGDVHQAQLVPVMLGLDLLNHLEAQVRTTSTEDLVNMAMAEISVARRLGTDARLQIYQRCVPTISDRSASATSAIRVMALFLAGGLPEPEAQRLIAMLPAKAVVDELRHYIERSTESGLVDWDMHVADLRSRVQVIVQMLSLTAEHDQENEDVLFHHLLGEQAINNYTRDVGWTELGQLSKSTRPLRAASHLLDRYLGDLVPSLPTEQVTPALVALLLERLMHVAADDQLDAQAGYVRVFSLPMWQTLVRLAAQSLDIPTAAAAVNAVRQVLFVWPRDLDDKAGVVKCHVEFVRNFVDWLCSNFADLSRFDVDSECRRFGQAVKMLEMVLTQSRLTQSTYEIVQPPTSISLCSTCPDTKPFCFGVQLCSPGSPQPVINVQASASTTVNELASALPDRTGTAHSKIIVDGRALDLAADASKKLSEAGVHASGVLMIYPTYTSDSDLDKVLTGPGPVEQELLAHHDRLGTFLDGPPLVGGSALRLLAALKPFASARFRITGAESTAAELFPSDRPYRTIYSLHILGSFLRTYARFAVADEMFILKVVHLLTNVLIDESRAFDAALMLQVANALLQFLLEKPSNAAPAQYFDQPIGFARRIMDLMSQTMGLKVEPATTPSALPVRTGFALQLYRILLQACRIDERVWNGMMGYDCSATLHARLLLDDDIALSAHFAACIENFCIEQASPADRVDHYWRIVMASCDQALERPFAATAYFQLTAELLNRSPLLQSDETEARKLVQELLIKLRSYTHKESPSYPMADMAIVGLLRLLGGTILLLKSFKKPLGLGSVSVELFERLLFPPTDTPSLPLLSDESRKAVFDIVRTACESTDDYRSLAYAACYAIQILPQDASSKFPGMEGWIRPPQNCAGLTNLGMTCYMNSLLQQLFANLPFRKFVFDTPVMDAEKQIFLHTVQELFTSMQDGPLCSAETINLAKVLDVQIHNQEDVHGFYAIFLSRLEDAMPDEERKKAFSKFYGGQFVSQIKGSCGHVSTKSESFNDVAITVKNKASLSESLNEFVQGEPMQGANRYRCLTCDTQDGLLVDAMKRTCLDEVPDNLTFCLKRFTFESMVGLEGKVNDRFEFPQQLDMAMYERQHVEQPEESVVPDIFELVGVIVHQGTLDFGHYWSYTRLAGSSTWVRLEDQNVQVCDGIADVQYNCFGGLAFTNGQEKTDNGYVLFYQRRSHLQEQAQMIRPLCGSSAKSKALPPRVHAPTELARKAQNEGLWRHRVANLFAGQFHTFVEWLISSFPSIDGDSSDDETMVDSPRIDDAEGPAAIAAKYLLRVVLTDVASQKKLQSCTQSITSAFDKHGTGFAKRLLQAMVDEPAFIAAIWRHDTVAYRAAASLLLKKCLSSLKTSGEDGYIDLFHQVVNMHSSILTDIGSIYHYWLEYFSFAADLAKLGAQETAIVLDGDYLKTVFDVSYLKWMDDDTKRRYQYLLNMMERGRIDLSPLFMFLHGVLSEHVDLSPVDHGSLHGGSHHIVDGLVQLSFNETEMLHAEAFEDQSKIWVLLPVGCQKCTATQNFENFAPGQLVALLTSPKSSPALVQKIERALIVRADAEQSRLKEMLFIALHFCLSRGDQQSKDVLKQLSKNLSQWPKCELDVLDFCTAAAKIAPSSTIENASAWATPFLRHNLQKVRRLTKLWLQDHVFGDAQPNAPQTPSRLRTSRMLAAQCLPNLKQAYDEDWSKTRLEEMFEVMLTEASWLSALHEDIQRVLENDDEEKKRMSHELMVEYDESQATLRRLKDTLAELSEWESDGMSLPSVALTDPRRSVEVVEDSELDADEEEEYSSSIEELEEGPP